MSVDVHQVEEAAIGESVLPAKSKNLLIASSERLLLGHHPSAVEATLVAPPTDGRHAPIIEDSGPSVSAAEAFRIHATFAKFLPEVEHERARHEAADEKCRQSSLCIAQQEVAGKSLLVVILQEVEHPSVDVVHRLPAGRNGLRALSLADVEQCVVESHFVVEVVEVAAMDVSAIEGGIVYFGDEDDFGIGRLDLRNGPFPELDGNHLGHIATEAVDALCRPVEQDVQHLMPCVGGRGEVCLPTRKVVDAVVQLRRLVPVIMSRPGCEVVVACCLCRPFVVGAAGHDVLQMQLF